MLECYSTCINLYCIRGSVRLSVCRFVCLDLCVFCLRDEQTYMLKHTYTIAYHHYEWFLANVNSSSCSLYVIGRPSVVCRLSVICNVGEPYSGD